MKLTKTQNTAIKKIFTTLELGPILNIYLIKEDSNIYYKVEVENKKTYILKEYTKKSIKNDYELQKRKKQITIAEMYSQNGIPAIIPYKFYSKFFIKYKKTYYLIYDYIEYKTINVSELTTKRIKKLANNLAIIHNLNVKSELGTQYKLVRIDLNKYLKKFKRINPKLYKSLYDSYFILENLLNNSNSSIRFIKNNLCASPIFYNLDNILWDKDYMYLVDFDSCYMANPSVVLAETAFSISYEDGKVNLNNYKEFVKNYVKKFGILSNNYRDALLVALNNKLQNLEYLMSKCTKQNKEVINKTITLINELVIYNQNIEEFNNIYLSSVKK